MDLSHRGIKISLRLSLGERRLAAIMFTDMVGFTTLGQENASTALELLEIDACGFDRMDRAILAAIIDKFDGGPVGVESLAAAVGEGTLGVTRLISRSCPTAVQPAAK